MNTIDAAQLSKMFLAGAKNLEANKEHINELNVFPVPDGDTGTNMTMTILSAAKEVNAIDELDMRSLCKAISSGSLRGARGNSGVILSQLFRGFTKVIKTENELTVDILCEAAQRAVETAYKAVMQPKEGTILTVARAAADKALELAETTDDIEVYLEGIVNECEEVLARTPEMLPVLKEAGVVDSGGEGLCKVLSGAYAFLSGKDMDVTIAAGETAETEAAPAASRFTYRLEFAMLPLPYNTHEDRRELRTFMKSMGDGGHLEKENGVYIGRLVTNDPGRIITKALHNGVLQKVTIENTKLDEAPVSAAAETPVKAEEKAPAKEIGVVAVSIGEGMKRIFEELGTDCVIEGGQTMNPSTEDIMDAIGRVNAKTVFVLPNNKNIILSANQAVELVKDKQVIVLPTKTLPQGISAMISFMPEESVEENWERMTEEIGFVKSGEITYAVRDTNIDGKEIKAGDYMGIGDDGILSVEKKLDKTVLGMLSEMVDDDSALITLYFGSDVKHKEAQKLYDKIRKAYSGLEVELQEGGQPVYYYVVSVE